MNISPETIAAVVSAIGILTSQSQVILIDILSVGMVGSILFIIGILGLIIYDNERQSNSKT